MKYHAINIIIISILMFAFKSWLLPAHSNVSTDLGYNFKSFTSGFEYPWSWTTILNSNGLGVDTTITLWTYPAQFFYQVLLKMSIPFWFQMKYFAFLPILLITYLGFKLISYRLKINPLFGSFIYLLNPYFLSIVDGGQLNLGIAYALIPLTVISSTVSYKSNTLHKYLSILLIWITSCFDLRIALIEIIIISLLFLINKKIRYIFFYLLATITFLALWHLYWIVPLGFSRDIIPAGYISAFTVKSLSYASLSHSLSLQPANWYLNQFGNTEKTRWYIFLYPIIAFGTLLIIKNKTLKQISLIGLIGILLAKGAQPPFGEVYEFIYRYLPGFTFFRDSSKFFMLITFSYSLLISYLFKFISSRSVKIALSIVILFSIIVWPVFTNRLFGTFAKPYLSEDVESSWKLFENNNEFFRSIWYPVKHPLGFSSTSHPSIDSLQLISVRPFATNIKGTYESLNFLRSEAVSEILKTASVKYFLFPLPDDRKKPLKEDEINYLAWLKNYFRNANWLKVVQQGKLDIYQLNNYYDRFRLVKSIAWIVGPDDTYQELLDLSIPLKDLAVIHLNEYPHLIEKISNDKAIDHRIVLNKTSKLDLKMLFLEREKLLKVSSLVSEDNKDPSGWWSRGANNFINVRSFLFEKYKLDFHDFDQNKGFLISESSHTLKIPLNKYGSLYARVLVSSRSGELLFQSSKDNVLISTIDNFTYLKWVKVLDNSQEKEIKITTKGDINIINTLVVLDDKEELYLQNKLDLLNIPIVDLTNYVTKPPIKSEKVNWQYINPTKYIVNGIDGSGLLVFSDSYNLNWRVNYNSTYLNSLPVYSYINGFYVNQSPVIQIEYSPQMYIYKTIPLSFVALLLPNLLALVLYIKRLRAHDK